jgi:hypothetical protein
MSPLSLPQSRVWGIADKAIRGAGYSGQLVLPFGQGIRAALFSGSGSELFSAVHTVQPSFRASWTTESTSRCSVFDSCAVQCGRQ